MTEEDVAPRVARAPADAAIRQAAQGLGNPNGTGPLEPTLGLERAWSHAGFLGSLASGNEIRLGR